MFVLLHTHIYNTTCCVKIPYYSFGKMKFDRLILKWPSIVFELLICSFTETTDIAVGLVLEMNFTANVLFWFSLDDLSFLFDPI